MRNTLKMKRMAGVAGMSLLMSVSSIASEELFELEFADSCGPNMVHVVDDVSAQGALDFLGTWATTSPNPSIKQRTFEAAEALIKKWGLQPPDWLPSILPIAVVTFTKLYEIPEHSSEENLAKAQKNFKRSLEEVALQAREGKLPALLSEETIEKLRQSQKEALQLIPAIKEEALQIIPVPTTTTTQVRVEVIEEEALQASEGTALPPKDDMEKLHQSHPKHAETQNQDKDKEEVQQHLTEEAKKEAQRQEEARQEARQEQQAKMKAQEQQMAEEEAERHRQAAAKIKLLKRQKEAEDEQKGTERGEGKGSVK